MILDRQLLDAAINIKLAHRTGVWIEDLIDQPTPHNHAARTPPQPRIDAEHTSNHPAILHAYLHRHGLSPKSIGRKSSRI